MSDFIAGELQLIGYVRHCNFQPSAVLPIFYSAEQHQIQCFESSEEMKLLDVTIPKERMNYFKGPKRFASSKLLAPYYCFELEESVFLHGYLSEIKEELLRYLDCDSACSAPFFSLSLSVLIGSEDHIRTFSSTCTLRIKTVMSPSHAMYWLKQPSRHKLVRDFGVSTLFTKNDSISENDSRDFLNRTMAYKSLQSTNDQSNSTHMLKAHATLKEILLPQLGNKSFNERHTLVRTETLSSLAVIHRYFEHPRLNKTIVLVGAPDSGKSTAVKTWISENLTELYDKNIIWTNLSLDHIFKIWLRHIHLGSERADGQEQIRTLLRLDEYFDLKFLYLLAKYQHEGDSILKRASEVIEASKEQFHYPVSRLDPDVTKKRRISEYLTEIKQIVKIYESNLVRDSINNHGFPYLEQLIDTSMNTRQLQKRRWIRCSRAIQYLLAQEGIRFLTIADGLRAPSRLLKSVNTRMERDVMLASKMMLSEVENYLRDPKHLAVVSKHSRVDVLVADSTAMKEIDSSQSLPTLTHDKEPRRYTIYHAAPSLKKIVRVKMNYLRHMSAENNIRFVEQVEAVFANRINLADEGVGIREFLINVIYEIECRMQEDDIDMSTLL